MYRVIEIILQSPLLLALSILSFGLMVLTVGLTVSIYRPVKLEIAANRGKSKVLWAKAITGIFDKMTKLFPLNIVKGKVNESLSFLMLNESEMKLLGSMFTLAICIIGFTLAALLFKLGQIWYSRALIVIMSFILPYYLLTLFLDLYRQRVTRQIPKLIDEFRGAFIKNGKVRSALMECGENVGGGMGRLVFKVSDSVFVEDSLVRLKEKFNNIWFNIFVTLIINFKENGGDLVDQLYQLNRTMTRHNNIEKKKNRRLIWYEVFAVAASVFSIPAVFWINNVILGNETVNLADAGANMMISQVILFSLLSLVIIRILRKM